MIESSAPPKKHHADTLVWLRRNHARPHIFYCPTCMYPLLKYQGAVAAIVPGGPSYDDAKPDEQRDFTDMVMKFPLVVECRGNSRQWGRCSAVYYFEGFTESASPIAE